MNRPIRRNPVFGFVVVTVFAFGVSGCCFLGFIGNCGSKPYCCEQYSDGGADQQYCTQLSLAAGEYIKGSGSSAVATEEERLELFEEFIETLKSCETLDCINATVDGSVALLAGFDPIFDERLAEANDVAGVNPDDRVSLVFCGLNNGAAKRRWLLENREG